MEINKVNPISLGDYQSASNIKNEPKITSEEARTDYKSKNKEKQVDFKELDLAINKANKVLFKNNTHLQFSVHKKTNEVMVKIINDESGEVLKEIPTEKMLDMVAKLWEIAGILVDEKA